MEVLLFGNLGTNEASESLGGSDLTWPVVKQGEALKIGWRPFQEIGGEATEVKRTVTAMRVSVGRTDDGPTSRDFSLTLNGSGQTFTVAGATFTCAAHGFADGDRVFLITTDALPDELRAERPYYIVNKTDDTFELSAQEGGVAIVTTGAGTGLHTVQQITPAIAFDADAATVQAALESLAGITSASVEVVDRSWLVEIDEGFDFFDLKVKFNRLRPVCFVRLRASERSGTWVHEIRPQQAPVALANDVTFEIHSPPQISEIVAGATVGTSRLAEKQEVVFDPLYRGIYEIRWNGRRTDLLDRDDGPEEWAAMLPVLADPDGTFRVTNPQSQIAHVWFEGEMAGIDQPLLEVYPVSGPAGDPYVTVNLATWEMAALLREIGFDDDDEAELDIVVEVDYEDWADDSKTLTYRYAGTIPVHREMLDAADAALVAVDYLRPYDPKEYKPYSSDQISVGHAGRRITFGDQVTTNYAHNLDTPDFIPFVWKRYGDLKPLAHQVDFEIVPNSDNDCDIVLLGDYDPAPGADTLTLLLVAIGDTSAFDNHTHEIAQVNLLREELDALWDAYDYLKQFLPKGKISTGSSTDRGGIDVWEFSPMFNVYPTNETIPESEIPASGSIADWRATPGRTVIRSGGLLPAIHQAALDDLSAVFDGETLPDAADHAGEVFLADLAAFDLLPAEVEQGVIVIPGGGGRRSARLFPGSYLGSDGRYWYQVTRHHDIADTTFTADATVGNEWLTLADNRLALGNVVQLETTDTLPAPFAILTDYYVVSRSGARVKLSATVDGDAIDATTAGAGVHTVTVAAKTSYYPTDFERELLIGAVNERQLVLKTSFIGNVGVEMALERPDRRLSERETRAQYSLAIQLGRPKEETGPAPIDLNLDQFDWEPNFALEHRVQVTRTPKVHTVGLRVDRYLDGGEEVIDLAGIISGIEIAGLAPDSANFGFRLLACKFDTENQVADPRGLVSVSGFNRTALNATRQVDPLGFFIIK